LVVKKTMTAPKSEFLYREKKEKKSAACFSVTSNKTITQSILSHTPKLPL